MPRGIVVALAGATATGKTAVGERVAARLGGAVVCADARQVYRELEIGTGKPTPAERAERPHRLFDWLDLSERATAGRWAREAAAVCERLLEDGVTPVLVGGSGLYLAALERGLHPEPPADAGLRARLEAAWSAEGPEAMHARLASLDPGAAASLRVRDRQRVLRALEIVTAGGRPLSWWRERPRAAPLAAEWRVFQLVCPPEVLGERIAARTRAMWEQGLLEETRGIVTAGKEGALRRLAAIGYDEALAVLAGTLTRDAAIERTAQRTRQLAKRQRTWFRHQLASEPIDAARIDDELDAIAERVASRAAA